MLDESHLDVEHWGQPLDLADQRRYGGCRRRVSAAMRHGQQSRSVHAAPRLIVLAILPASSAAPDNPSPLPAPSRSRSPTTSPITTTAGGLTSCRAASAATCSSVEVSTCWVGIVPSLITATGVAPARPRLISSLLIASRWATAIRSTRVPGPLASDSQSTLAPGIDGSRWAETTAKSWVMPRCVTGMPAYAGTATALVTPGTTSNGTPARTHARASSPPRPKTNG